MKENYFIATCLKGVKRFHKKATTTTCFTLCSLPCCAGEANGLPYSKIPMGKLISSGSVKFH